jgi:hypothetical protein
MDSKRKRNETKSELPHPESTRYHAPPRLARKREKEKKRKKRKGEKRKKRKKKEHARSKKGSGVDKSSIRHLSL